MELNLFKELVDNSSAKIPEDIKSIYEYLNITETNTYRSSEITDHLYQNICNALNIDTEHENTIKTNKILLLKDELVFRKVLFGENQKKYLEVLNVIRYATQNELKNIPNLSSLLKWKQAIQHAMDYLKFSPNTFSQFSDLREEYPKEYDRATAAKKLQTLGCNVEINNSILTITNLDFIFKDMSSKVENIGGLTLARFIFDFLAKYSYSENFERYKITRHTSTLEFDHKPQIPFGYLLNLCVKFPFDKKKSLQFQKEVNDILDLSTTIVTAVYGAQPYSQWEYIFADGEKTIALLTNIALWDSMYTIPQCKPTLAIDITFGIFERLSDNAFYNNFGHTKGEVNLVSQKILEQIKNINGPIEIHFTKLCKNLYRLKKSKIEQILDVFSHSKSANKDYHEPSDYLKIDFNFKPFIKIGKLKYLIMDKSWCAPSYFETVAAKIRETNKHLDQQLGHPMEDFLHQKFKEKGIIALTGEYTYMGQDGECDFLIESDKSIILIEAKKKVLTRKSKSGNDIDIILDLSDSVLEAQRQAGRTAIILLESESITLKQADGNDIKVQLNGREIEKIALTQLEFGGFQDRVSMEQFLKSLLTHTINTNLEDPRIVKKIKDLANKQKDWIEQYIKFKNLDPHFEHWPYRNCWFFSLQQMLELINLSHDNNSFEEALKANKYVSIGTMDWYSEYEYTLKMNSSIKE